MPQKDSMFKSKHKLDLSLVSMDQRGKHLLGYTDSEMSNKGGYDLVHYDDLAYVASAHQECENLFSIFSKYLIAFKSLKEFLTFFKYHQSIENRSFRADSVSSRHQRCKVSMVTNKREISL
jgi:hypothetical protein